MAQPSPLVPQPGNGFEELERTREELAEWFRRRRPGAWLVQPNPEVDDGPWRLGFFVDGTPFDVRPIRAAGTRRGSRDSDAWSHLFGYGWTVPLPVPAEPAEPGLPHAGGVDAAAAGPATAVASFDQSTGAWAAAMEPAHGADAPVDSGTAAVATPDPELAEGNVFLGFLSEPCHCVDVVGCHTLGDCRWSHLHPDFHLSDPYGTGRVADEDDQP